MSLENLCSSTKIKNRCGKIVVLYEKLINRFVIHEFFFRIRNGFITLPLLFVTVTDFMIRSPIINGVVQSDEHKAYEKCAKGRTFQGTLFLNDFGINPITVIVFT